MKTLAILVGGGPAPGINAVIAAATMEARRLGIRILGCHEGYRWLIDGNLDHVEELDVTRVFPTRFDGGSILGTSRANPVRTALATQNVADALRRLGVSHLVTIGGDDTALGAARVAEALHGQLAVAHVPKTIDNDLPLPHDTPTFGFTTSVDVGKDLVRNLMTDASTTSKWFFVTVMGRHAGHLALGIGAASGATLTIIGEELPQGATLGEVADRLEAAIIKQRVAGHHHGVALLSEGILERLEPATLGPVARDAYGNVRLEELDLSRLLRQQVSASLRARDLELSIVPRELGYELRCAPPGGFDLQYCRSLGYWAVRFLVEGGSDALITIQDGRFVPMRFGDLLEPGTGKVRVRYVDMGSAAYRTHAAYMVRLTRRDLDDPDQLGALAQAGRLSEAAFSERFSHLVASAP